jgi:hypothetical protein
MLQALGGGFHIPLVEQLDLRDDIGGRDSRCQRWRDARAVIRHFGSTGGLSNRTAQTTCENRSARYSTLIAGLNRPLSQCRCFIRFLHDTLSLSETDALEFVCTHAAAILCSGGWRRHSHRRWGRDSAVHVVRQ